MLQLDDLLPELVQISLLVFDLFLELHICFAVCLSFLHPALHLLDQLGKLSILFILLQECLVDLSVLGLHLADHCVSLLEFLFNYFELLWVGKRVFAFDYLFKLVPQPGTFIHVELNFYLNFC